jgi:cyclomaltodextrinase / maltogenic alpha-amylase / neopullulanase
LTDSIRGGNPEAGAAPAPIREDSSDAAVPPARATLPIEAQAVPISGPDWVRDAVFYQIFPDRFASSARVPKPGPFEGWDAPPTNHGFKGGDLLGVAEHLDELADLGITALYLCPVFASASNHRYHIFDYEKVDPLLGGNAALRELLDSAHARGMRVILDGVFNHASRGFWPFNHLLENGANSPYRDWFYLDPLVRAGRRGLVAYPGRREAAAMARHRENGRPRTASEHVLGYQAWWDLPALPKLNHSNPAVREYIFGIAERWLRFGIDGWRLDVPQEIGEPGFWEEFRRRVLAVKPDAYIVGEIWRAAPEWLAGDRFHALMNYPLSETILSFVGAGRMDEALLAKTHEFAQNVCPIDGPEFGRQLQRVMTTYEPAVIQEQLNLLDSHDTPRFLSLAGGDRSALRLAWLIQMTLPGSPCLYYGDEIGLEGREDPDCRRAYPWDPAHQDIALRSFVAGLIALRRSEPALRRGTFRLLGAEGSVVAYALDYDGARGTEGEGSSGARGSDGAGADPGRPGVGRPAGRRAAGSAAQSIIIVVNAADSPDRIRLGLPDLSGRRLEQVSWPGCEWTATFAPTTLREETLEIALEAREGVVLRAGPNL